MEFKELLTEFKQRQIFKVASLYLVTAWMMIQVFSIVLPTFNAPNSWMRTLTVALVAGFPIILLVTWLSQRKFATVRSRKQAGWIFYTVLMMFLGVGIGALLNRINSKSIFPERVRNERIAVMVFSNQTGDAVQDGIGGYLAMNLGQSFQELKDVKVVNPETVRQNMKYAGFFPGNPEGNISFAEATEAAYIIGGDYYAESGDSLRIKTYLTDARNGDILFYFPEITGSLNDKPALSNQLKQVILGYWVNKDQVDKGKYRTPKYDAYLAYLEGQRYFGIDYPRSMESYQKAIQLDSNFTMSHFSLMGAYSNLSQLEKRDSILELLKSRYNSLTEYERLGVDASINLFDAQDLKAVYGSIYKMYQKDPKNPLDNTNAGMFSNWLHNYNNTIEIFTQIDDRTVDYTSFTNTWRLFHFAQAYIETGQEQKAIDYLDAYLPKDSESTISWMYKIRAHARLGQVKEIKELIANYPSNKIQNISTQALFNYYAAYEFALLEKQDLANEFADKALAVYDSEKGGLEIWRLVNLYFIKQDWANATKWCEQIEKENPTDIYNLARLGILATKKVETNNRAEAMRYIEAIENTDIPPSGSPIGEEALKAEVKAMIYAHLGEEDKAIELLRNAQNLPSGPLISILNSNIYLRPLFNNPAFQELIGPRD